MDTKYGLLINQNTTLHRSYFSEMVTLLGVNVIYRYPTSNDHYTLNGEIKIASYSDGETIGCIFNEHLDNQTAKKLGWDAELTKDAAVIHVPYDLENLQIGCLFEIPAAFENAENRLFRVTKISAQMIYPASLSCELVPDYIDTMPASQIQDFTNSNFNLLNEG